MAGFLRKDPQFTTFCTQFITFVVQYACVALSLDSTQILGKIRDTKATPARLVELLKRNPCFTESKNCDDDDYDDISIATLAHNTQAIYPISDPSPMSAWSPRPAPLPPSQAAHRPAPPPPQARVAPARPAPLPPDNNLSASPFKRQGARRWSKPPGKP